MIVQIEDVKYKVSWRHIPPNEKPMVRMVKLKNPIPFVKFHGQTQCIIEYLDTGEPKSIRIAQCSKKDNFNKSKGRIVSLTKAIKHLPKDVRTLFFKQYEKEIGF